MKLNIEDILIKLILISPIAMLLQRVFDPANKVIIGMITILLSLIILKRCNIKYFTVIGIAMLLFSISLLNINKSYFNVNMLFYYPLYILYLIYVAKHYSVFIRIVNDNFKFIKMIILIWCGLIVISAIFPTSYKNGMFMSFSNGPFRLAPTALFILILVWIYCGISKNKRFSIISIIPFLTIASTGSRTYTMISLIFLLYILYGYFESKLYFYILLIPTLFVIVSILLQTSFIDKMESAINNKYVDNPLAAFTSGRSTIWLGEIKLFLKANIFEQLLGEGITSSYVKNVSITGQEIWAHNDFMEILNCHGILGIILYIYTILEFSTMSLKHLKLSFKSKIIFWTIFLFNAFFNGVYVYATAMLSIPFTIYALSFDFKTLRNSEGGI